MAYIPVRNSLTLYSDTDPSQAFALSNSSGVVTIAVDASDELTVSGKTIFDGADTYVNRDPSAPEVSLETLFDNLDTNVAANATNNTAEIARAISAEQALDIAWGAASTAIAADDASNHAIALGAIASEATRAGIAEGAIAANLATEVTRAVAAETGFTDDLNALTAVEVAHIAALNTALTNEVARASAAEANIQSDEDANQAAASAALASSDAALAAGVLSNSNALAAQSASAQAAEATMAGHIANILSNSDGASLDSLQEVVEFFDGADETHTNLVGLLMNKVLQLNEVINTFLDPDMPALDAVLQSYYDANLCITSLSSGTGSTGATWLYGTISGQNGWASMTNDYAQTDNFSGTSMVSGDQQARGNSIVGIFTDGDGLEETGQVFEGTKAWHFKRGYDNAGSGTAQTPNIAAAGNGETRNVFEYSFKYRAHQANDSSRLAVISGKDDQTDRSSNYMDLMNDAAEGMSIRVYDHGGAGAGWSGAYTTIASGLAFDSWQEVRAVMTSSGGYDDTWNYYVNGILVHTSLGYFNQARQEFGFGYEATTAVKFQPRHANYDSSFMGFYFDNVSLSSYNSSDETGTMDTYYTDFESTPPGTSISSVLGDGIPHSGSSEAHAYFLSGAFDICYDLTQRVTVDENGSKTARGWDYITEDLSIVLQVVGGVDAATASSNWSNSLTGAGGPGNEEAAFISLHTISSIDAMKGSILAAYGFTPSDLDHVCLPYSDPGNYVLEVGQYGDRPYFKGSEVAYEAFVGWSLSYCTTPGDVSTKYSTIISGSQVGNDLAISTELDTTTVSRAIEWPVNGNAITGAREGTFIADITQLMTV